jgi:transmembrane sensor
MDSTPQTDRGVPSTPEDGAAYWLMREKAAALPAQERDERDAWLDRHPANRDAYLRARALWNALGTLAADAPMRELRSQALDARNTKRRPPMRWMLGLGAALAASLAGVSIYFQLLHERAAGSDAGYQEVRHYRTGIGERATVTLKDGSTVTLNTASDLMVRFTEAERSVELRSGQGFFTIAPDAKHPFVVLAGDRRVTAIGTAFDVRVDRDEVQVVLVEGKVAVAPIATATARVELEAGERFVSESAAMSKVLPANVESSTSWRSGRVVFTDTSLADAVAEINRYRPRPILIGDPAVASFRISGTYRLSEVDRFADVLTAYYPLQQLTRPSGETVLLARP